ncbi:HsmA family protein [Faecalispora anaeroviscerum]|uniref:HsmA family protein n=1 Tax=Faecalispora anaeroviscerum TaxID=2991836 RepID=UPI0024BAF652|nr:HsmA family protein [Faecalispora anaeroviscerum]
MAGAIVTITLAFLFYTIGVWAEKYHGSLKNWHVIVFWIGFAFDTIGTMLMRGLSHMLWTFNFHSITGILAIALMLFHAVWATYTLLKGNEIQKQNFHKFSILVWVIWLIPYFSGMIVGMTNR